MDIFYNMEFLKKEIEETRRSDVEAEIECERIKTNNKVVREGISNTLNSFNDLIMNNSWFDLNIIGHSLSKLLSVTQNKEYEFKCMNNYIETVTYQIPFPRSEKRFYNIYYLMPKINFTPPREENIVYGLEKSFFDKNNDIIVLKKDIVSDKRNNNINFYDKFGNKNINVKNIDIVYKFINDLISYKIENNINEMSRLEIDKFIEKYNSNKLLKKAKVF